MTNSVSSSQSMREWYGQSNVVGWRGCRKALAVGAELPHGVEVLTAIGLESDESARVYHARQPVQPPGHHFGQVFEVAYSHDGDHISLASNRVGLRDPFDSGDLLSQFSHASRLSVDENKCCDHSPNVAPLRSGVPKRSPKNK